MKRPLLGSTAPLLAASALMAIAVCSEGGGIAHPRLTRTVPEDVGVLRALSDAVLLEDLDTEQTWAMIFPKGDVIETRDDRAYSFSDREAFVAAFNADPVDAMVDIDHDSVFYSWTPPAEGWVKELKLEDGAILARIEWTASGQARLDAKTYRYLSPAFHHDKFGVITSLHSVALVNQPALTMPAVASRQDAPAAAANPSDTPSDPPPAKKELAMTPEELATLRAELGLAEDADVPTVLAACAEMRTRAATAAAEQVTIESHVPRADYDALATRVSELEGEKTAAASAKPSAEEVAQVVDAAIASARIAPASRDHYVSLCSTADGFERVKALVKVAPVVVDTAATQELAQSPGTASVINDNEAAVCKALGISPKVAAARREKRRA